MSQTQLPAEQAWSAPQVTPHPPQLLRSVWKFGVEQTHSVPEHCHVPQVWHVEPRVLLRFVQPPHALVVAPWHEVALAPLHRKVPLLHVPQALP